MSIEKQLESNFKVHENVLEDYYQNPDKMMESDVLEFSKALGRKNSAYWAQTQYMTSSYNMAKKIIETIN